ncbi:putative NeuA [Sulfuricella denitrificans skB26]|uniref:Putative NeuA n=1 Tax=Sulfuricella denitrificans (strain DSM 22764 / NBRC 105220 / skB26) TaxID=1163617 RepID=S6AP84_SULDS|nr:pseudaminic acid cytidylyltransferase [Sulfuricella denitrificans]BAN36704.1 putative NeuA [Sulfuricella denitrificans skB26]
MKIAVIPARGGSKRIPRKNIKDFCGKPMIAHAISAAKQSGLFEHVIVSTDDEEIARIACEWGAEAPFTRPAELADDHAPTVPVVAHATTACQALGWEISYVCCIYPGVPFIQIEDLSRALDLLQASQAAYSFPVTEFPSAIQRALRRLPNGQMQPFYPEYELTRTQDLEPAYHDAGQFYWGKPDTWLTNNKIHRSGIGLPIPSWRVVDIDTPDDWERAGMLYAAFNK